MSCWSCLSAHICVAKDVYVALILVIDQLGQILVIEALAVAGLVADDSVVVQIDADQLLVLVEQLVHVFRFARFFRFVCHNFDCVCC